MTGSVSVARADPPGQGQGSFFEFAEITKPQHHRAIFFGREERQPQGIIGVRPIGIGEDKNIPVRVGNLARPVVHGFIFLIDVLKVKQPTVEVVLETLRNGEVRGGHEVLLQADIGVRRVTCGRAFCRSPRV